MAGVSWIHMRRLFYFSLFLLFVGFGVYLNSLNGNREVFRSVCDLAEDHFYKVDERLAHWVRACRMRAAELSLSTNLESTMAMIQDHMNIMTVSHFQLYSPVEDRKLWKGETVDTGIRSRYIEDHLIVYKVFPGSSAAEAGVRPGDEILALPGSDQVTPYGAEHRSGIFTVKRGEDVLRIEIAPKPLVIDSKPSLEDLGGGHALLEISSFRSEFFPADEWRALGRQVMRYRHVIIDLRENSGGNFVAMLRAASTFLCADQSLGVLLQPRKSLEDKLSLEDNTDDGYQIKELETFRRIGLVTFPGYGCYRGRVTVLVSSATSSVAEIFAQAFVNRPGGRVWGQPTAGDVVLAVWYDLPRLGPGFSVSVPEAIYLTPEGEELEGRGVYPKRELYYDLGLALKGKDSWIVDSMGGGGHRLAF
jgi:carboxyl-terminal processing protease